MGARLTIVIVIAGLCYGALLFRLYDLQILHGAYLLAKTESRYVSSELLAAHRGTIYFTNRRGERTPVALTKEFPLIYADPSVVRDAEGTANAIAPVLGMYVEDLTRTLSNASSNYALLVKKADPSVAGRVNGMNIPGIYTATVPGRFYPYGTLAAHLFGYLGPSEDFDADTGHYGLEEFYNGLLSGMPGRFEGKKFVPPVTGEDLALTVDLTIQSEAEKILSEAIARYRAKSGSIIVQDPKTGGILAMANRPSFNPNAYQKSSLADFLNPSVQSLYEPGSVIKVITMAAGLDSGAVRSETTYKDTGVFEVSGKKIRNFKNKKFGLVTMAQVIEHSINTGAAFVEKKIGHARFAEYLEQFGLGERTGIDLLGEVEGDLRRLTTKAPDIAFSTASFGQGIAITPLELINAVSAIANGGTLMRPYVHEALGPEAVRTVVSPSTARSIARIMTTSVDVNELARVSGFSIAGKTGTAQVPDLKKGGYTDEVINTYVGFGPTSDPRFVILVKLDEPEGAPPAGQTALPAFRDLAQFILNYYQVPPDRI